MSAAAGAVNGMMEDAAPPESAALGCTAVAPVVPGLFTLSVTVKTSPRSTPGGTVSAAASPPPNAIGVHCAGPTGKDVPVSGSIAAPLVASVAVPGEVPSIVHWKVRVAMDPDTGTSFPVGPAQW